MKDLGQKRQLSAIMFTDLEGYTSLMQENESNAKRIRDEHRKILTKEIDQFEGRILQFYGDGALSIFNSTISATQSAISIQSQSSKNNIPLRIGIHSGDVVIDTDGVYGDGVNIASRIESFSVPGSVMISDKVYDDLKNQEGFEAALMGEFELKNVKKPVEVYALTNEGLRIPQRTELKGKVKERIKSLAVLPFSNLSSDPELGFFADGLAEELIIQLSKINTMKLSSRTSSFSLKGKALPIKEIGDRLDVQSVLEGSVRKFGNRLRITAQLGSCLDGYELWTEVFDREVMDYFDLQDEISGRIVDQLLDHGLITKEAEGRSDKPKIDPLAYKLYQEGHYYYHKWTPGSAKKAVEKFQEALEIDPAYADAQAGMALAYILLASTGWITPSEGSKLAVECAEGALEIDPGNDDALSALSVNDFFFLWDFQSGDDRTKMALDLNPRSAQANISRSLHFMVGGNIQQAISCLDLAREIDPLSIIGNRTLADAHYFAGNYNVSIEIYDWILEKEPDFLAAKEFKAWALLMNGNVDEAIGLFESIHETIHTVKPYVQLGYAYALKGDRKKANFYLDMLKKDKLENPHPHQNFNLAILYSGLKMNDEAFEALERCIESRLSPIVFLNVSPIWKPLRSDSRFEKVLEKIGLKRAAG